MPHKAEFLGTNMLLAAFTVVVAALLADLALTRLVVAFPAALTGQISADVLVNPLISLAVLAFTFLAWFWPATGTMFGERLIMAALCRDGRELRALLPTNAGFLILLCLSGNMLL